jgi:hypothetical protein
MARHRGPLLVDTNVIIECWRVGAWRALANGYSVETVDECMVETQTGYQRRSPTQQIDDKALRASLKAIHDVTNAEKAAAMVRDQQFAFLDVGEQALWAHALARSDAWMFCGPDRASLRFGLRLGLRDRLVALKRLLRDAGYNPAGLRTPYTSTWLTKTLGDLAALEGISKP